MDFSDYLELNKPKLKLSKNEIVIDTNYSNVGNIKIENIAGGFLNGEIVKYDDFIELSTNIVDKNLIVLDININKELINGIKNIDSTLKVLTNGGDKLVNVKVINETLSYKVNEVTKLYSLKDLFSFYKKTPEEVQTFFEKKDFEQWLKSFDDNIIRIYDYVKNDENILKRIDNFFVLLGFKTKTEIRPVVNELLVEIMPFEDKDYKGSFKVKKDDNGYCDCNLYISKNAFIKLDKLEIKNEDFDDDNEFEVFFEIDIEKLKTKREDIIININNFLLKIIIKKISKVHISINKSIYKESEVGFILIEDNFKSPIKYTATTNNKNIVILNPNGKTDISNKIEFVIKFTKFNKGVFKFFNQPYFDGVIDVVLENEKFKLKKEMNITIATENMELE